ncbi:MAG TPA: hypothetical protein VFB96_16180, partial [Pirellulaceae bacterium]|nr:hypothetical protein [Pirellulaceae bacterium]
MNRIRTSCVATILSGFLSSVLTGQQLKLEATGDVVSLKDSDGEPLPMGAKFRVGTRRFRHDTETTVLSYSPNGKLLACSGPFAHAIRVFDAETGKVHRSIKPDLPNEVVCGSAFVNDDSLI